MINKYHRYLSAKIQFPFINQAIKTFTIIYKDLQPNQYSMDKNNTHPTQVKARGGKNVSNAVQKTMLSLIRLEPVRGIRKRVMLKKQANKVKTPASVVTWIFVFLLEEVPEHQARTILNNYIQRMTYLRDHGQTHQNEDYQTKKIQKIDNFIESARILYHSHSLQDMLASLDPLYKYQTSLQQQKTKLANYLQLSQIVFQMSNTQQGDIYSVIDLNQEKKQKGEKKIEKKIEKKQEKHRIVDQNDQDSIPMQDELLYESDYRKQNSFGRSQMSLKDFQDDQIYQQESKFNMSTCTRQFKPN